MPTKRVVLERVPEVDPTYHHEGSPWASRWVAHPKQGPDQTAVVAYRLRFKLEKAETIRAYVSADQRYELFVDGERVGRGSERGDQKNWYFEAYDVDLPAGEHVVVARTWWLHPSVPSAYAQVSVRPAFWFHAEGEHQKLLSTGLGAWEAKILNGYSFHLERQQAFMAIAGHTQIDGSKFPWGVERGDGDGWEKVTDVGIAAPGWLLGEWPEQWILWPATLPPMYQNEVHVGIARWVGADKPGETLVSAKTNLAGEEKSWNELLAGQGKVTVPAGTARRIIVDLQDYYCAFPRLTVSGGKGTTVRVRWAESLYIPGGHPWAKGNRNEIEGKVFRGMGEKFTLDGGAGRLYEALWWEAGRYIEFYVETAGEPVTIDAFSLDEEHYPHRFEAKFESSDERMAGIIPLAERVLEMCSHETYMDCPYYEQLMYVGDTRLETLVTYATTRDDRLPRKALHTFDVSRTTDGLTQARYPSRVRQFIPPFSLWWVAMVHDYALWRDDVAFVRERMPGVRAVLDAYRSKGLDEHGLLGAMPGWNFADWVTGWASGVPPTGTMKPVAIMNMHLAWVLRQAAELEELVGEPEQAARNRRTADQVTRAANEAFWREDRGLYAEDLDGKHFSQHAQCLALLGDSVPKDRRTRVADGLFSAKDLDPTTIYFTHYYFEACRRTGRMDKFFERLEPWYELRKLGFKTTVEMPEPARSDCHAWGSHPVFHYYATVLGIRPGSMGFRTVRIEPQLGPLDWARGTMTHPKGLITVDLRKSGDRLTGTIDLPDGVSGQVVLVGQAHELNCGPNRL